MRLCGWIVTCLLLLSLTLFTTGCVPPTPPPVVVERKVPTVPPESLTAPCRFPPFPERGSMRVGADLELLTVSLYDALGECAGRVDDIRTWRENTLERYSHQ